MHHEPEVLEKADRVSSRAASGAEALKGRPRQRQQRYSGIGGRARRLIPFAACSSGHSSIDPGNSTIENRLTLRKRCGQKLP